MKLNQEIKKREIMVVLGSHDLNVPAYGAELFLKGFAQQMLITGGLGKLTKTLWQQTEAEKFAEIIQQKGVPENKILLETEATNLGENIVYSKKLLKSRNITIKDILIVTKPYYERRAFCSFKKQWPEVELNVTSEPVSFKDYYKQANKDIFLNLLTADLQRFKIYPPKGYQIKQDIPDEVWNAFSTLKKAGYTKFLQ